MKKLCADFDNVQFLDAEAVEVDGVKIIGAPRNSSVAYASLGATLWSFVHDEYKELVRRSLNDYHQIFVEIEEDNGKNQ